MLASSRNTLEARARIKGTTVEKLVREKVYKHENQFYDFKNKQPKL